MEDCKYIKPLVYKVGDFLNPTAWNEEISCNHVKIAESIINPLIVELPDGGEDLVSYPAGSEWKAITDAPGLVAVIRVSDPNKGEVWVDKADYLAKIGTCNSCCV